VRVAGICFTLAEAATLPEIGGHLGEDQLREIVHALRWQADGQRRSGKSGRPCRTYEAGRLMRLAAALAPFLGDARDGG